MAISSNSAKALAHAVGSKSVANELVDAMNKGSAAPVASPVAVVAAIVATAVSQTTDFGALLVGDKVAMIPATAGNADFISISVAGDLGQAAVVGNMYIVLRPNVAQVASAIDL